MSGEARRGAWLRSRLFLGGRLVSNLAAQAVGLRRPGLEDFLENYGPDGILPVPAGLRPFILGGFQGCTGCDLCLPACGQLEPRGPGGFPGPRDIVLAASRDPTAQHLNLDVLGRCDSCGLCEDACPRGVPIRAVVAHAARNGIMLAERGPHSLPAAPEPIELPSGRQLAVLAPCGGAGAAAAERATEFLVSRGAVARVAKDLPACGAREYADGGDWIPRHRAFLEALARTGTRELLPLAPCCRFILGDPVARASVPSPGLAVHSIWGFLDGWQGPRPGSLADAAILLGCQDAGERAAAASLARLTGAARIEGLCCGGWGSYRERHAEESIRMSRRVLDAAVAAGRARVLVSDGICGANLERARRPKDPAVQDLLQALLPD